MKAKRILALLGVIILIALYISSLVLSLLKHPLAGRLFLSALLCTIIIPIFLHIVFLLLGAMKGKGLLDETYSYRDSKKEDDAK
ncbi:MAG: hypothetical protein J6O55_05935 [Lachnospiraceae bacterium]|nr:hypothetical protein [Lachnospiraceae bacterium]